MRIPAFLGICLFWSILPQISANTSSIKNITVDDSKSDPLTGNTIKYSPATGWHQGNNCPQCEAKADPGQVAFGTWQEATYNPNATKNQSNQNEVPTAQFAFIGSAIYVYGIQSHSSDSPNSSSDVFFSIDGVQIGHYSYTPAPNSSQSFTYDVVLYANSSIGHGQHKLTIQNGQSPGGGGSLILLDYLIYTRGKGDSPPSSKNITRVVASVVPVAVICVAAVLGFLYLRRRRRLRKVGLYAGMHTMESDSDRNHVSNGIEPFAPVFGVGPIIPSAKEQNERSQHGTPATTRDPVPSSSNVNASSSQGETAHTTGPPAQASRSGLELPPAYDLLSNVR